MVNGDYEQLLHNSNMVKVLKACRIAKGNFIAANIKNMHKPKAFGAAVTKNSETKMPSDKFSAEITKLRTIWKQQEDE